MTCPYDSWLPDAPAPDTETTMHHLELIPDTGAAIAAVNAAHAAGIIDMSEE